MQTQPPFPCSLSHNSYYLLIAFYRLPPSPTPSLLFQFSFLPFFTSSVSKVPFFFCCLSYFFSFFLFIYYWVQYSKIAAYSIPLSFHYYMYVLHLYGGVGTEP